MRYETETHRMINDEIAPQDLAMSSFREAFRLTRCLVSEDGMTMQYRLRNALDAECWIINAGRIIEALNLPLQAKLYKWESGGMLREVYLCIIYKSS